MIIAHLADLHLGYRAYQRLAPGGENLREADVAAAFADAVEQVVALAPDMVIVAGDVFHTVRPTNAAIASAFRRFASLAERLPGVPVLIVAGDRETPRSADTASILELFREIRGTSVVTGQAGRIRFESPDCSVLLLPHAAIAAGATGRIAPEPGAAVNVLALHGVLAAGGDAVRAAQGGALLPTDAVHFEEWDYVALGHLPISLEIAPNAWYAGSLEHTSPHPWGEAEARKGFLSYDTETRAVTFHPVAAREVVDLPRISAADLSGAELNRAIRSACEGIAGGIGGRIVRLVLTEMPRERMRELDHAMLRAYRGEAVHFLLDPRPPAREVRAIRSPVRGRTLEALVEEYLNGAWTPTMEGVGRERLLELARGYLARAGEREE